jgi:hypothetical protein
MPSNPANPYLNDAFGPSYIFRNWADDMPGPDRIPDPMLLLHCIGYPPSTSHARPVRMRMIAAIMIQRYGTAAVFFFAERRESGIYPPPVAETLPPLP